MSVLSKVVIGGIAFVAGALVAAKEDDKPKHGCCKHHQNPVQQPPIQPNPYASQWPYNQPANGMQAPIQPTQRIPIQTDDKNGKKVDIGQLNVYGGDKLLNDDLLNLPQFKQLPLLPNQIKKLLSNDYVRKAILVLLERNGIDTSRFRFDEDLDQSHQGVSQPQQSAPSQPFTGGSAAVATTGPSPETFVPNGLFKDGAAQYSTQSVKGCMGVDQAARADADTVERRAHSSVRISDEPGLRLDPSAQFPLASINTVDLKKDE